jgi:hypothetical protein
MMFKLNVPYANINEEKATFLEAGDTVGYQHFTRLDLLCGFPCEIPVHPCKVCGRETCKGRSKRCKNEGAHSLGVSIK